MSLYIRFDVNYVLNTKLNSNSKITSAIATWLWTFCTDNRVSAKMCLQCTTVMSIHTRYKGISLISIVEKTLVQWLKKEIFGILLGIISMHLPWSLQIHLALSLCNSSTRVDRPPVSLPQPPHQLHMASSWFVFWSPRYTNPRTWDAITHWLGSLIVWYPSGQPSTPFSACL